jgi:NADH-quinone oxidoreductase subunit L
MAIPLVVLAIGSIFAGYVGVPHALKGSNWLHGFLAPSFSVSGASHGAESTAAAAAAPAAGIRTVAFQGEAPAAQAEAHATEDAHAEEVLELQLMAISSGIAVAGIGLAWFFWLRRRDLPDSMARSLSGPYRLLLNKYYVDELYNAAIVQPIKLLSTAGLWKGMDAGVIDGAVNGVGAAVSAGSGGLRRLQTGSVRTYAASLFLGVVLILGYYLFL